MARWIAALLFGTLWMVLAADAKAADGPSVVLWHAYRGEEEKALKQVAQAWETQGGARVDLLAIPFEAYASKLVASVPHGHGPDLFIEAHERLPSYLREGVVSPLGAVLPPADAEDFDPAALAALSVSGQAYGLPLSSKCLALFVNERLLPKTPATLEELTHETSPDIFPLAYDTTSAFFHAPFLHAFGGSLVDDQGRFAFWGPEAARSVAFVRGLVTMGAVPEEPSGALVKQLFLSERAKAVISGPWFTGELRESDPTGRLKVRIEKLPRIESATEVGGGVMRPLLTVEGLFVTPKGSPRPEAIAFARWIGGAESSRVRAAVGRQVVARKSVWKLPELSEDEDLKPFREAAALAIPTSTAGTMRAAWVPANQAILKVLRGDMAPEPALLEAKHRFEDVTRPPPPPADPRGALLAFGVLLTLLTLALLRRVRHPDWSAQWRASRPAYAYVTHAAIAVTVLVIFPLAAGALTSLFAGTRTDPHYVGFANYGAILTARGGDLLGHGSFYLTLLVTVVWTVANVVCHVAIGLVLGIALSQPWLRLRAIYRVLLVLPWAVPSYVTALAWKGMFHRQFGAVNTLLRALGAEPVSWFSQFSTAFTANVATNVWLGFPFMMVVTMGALTAIPKEVMEAAEVDGATRWQRFRLVTLPLLRPALLPSVVLGAVWTFNMFNVVFLVSGGEPDGTTDILVSEAYRWAFTRDAQFGYAAAYAVLIFLLLFAGSRIFARKFGGNEEAVG